MYVYVCIYVCAYVWVCVCVHLRARAHACQNHTRTARPGTTVYVWKKKQIYTDKSGAFRNRTHYTVCMKRNSVSFVYVDVSFVLVQVSFIHAQVSFVYVRNSLLYMYRSLLYMHRSLLYVWGAHSCELLYSMYKEIACLLCLYTSLLYMHRSLYTCTGLFCETRYCMYKECMYTETSILQKWALLTRTKMTCACVKETYTCTKMTC